MKKLFIVFLIIASIFAYTPIMAAELVADEQVFITTNGDQSIEYIPSLNGYYLENITLEEFNQAMKVESDDNIFANTTEKVLVEENKIDTLSSTTNYILEKDEEITISLLSTYGLSYELYFTCPGRNNETISLNYFVTMNVTTYNFAGVDYVKFVSFKTDPSTVIDSRIYQVDNSMAAAKGTIKNGGATLEVSGDIRLVYSTTTSYSATVGTEFWSFGYSYGDTYYYYGPTVNRTVTYNLPIYSILV